MAQGCLQIAPADGICNLRGGRTDKAAGAAIVGQPTHKPAQQCLRDTAENTGPRSVGHVYESRCFEPRTELDRQGLQRQNQL